MITEYLILIVDNSAPEEHSVLPLYGAAFPFGPDYVP